MTIRRRSTVRALEVAPAVMAFCQVCGEVLPVQRRLGVDHEHVWCSRCLGQHVYYPDEADVEFVPGTGKTYWRLRAWLGNLVYSLAEHVSRTRT